MEQPSRKRQGVGSNPTVSFVRRSSNGRTSGSDPEDRGSNPRLRACRSVAQLEAAPSLHLGGRGFDSCRSYVDKRGRGSIGRALVLHTGDCGFESRRLHQAGAARMAERSSGMTEAVSSILITGSFSGCGTAAVHWFWEPAYVGSNPAILIRFLKVSSV